MAVACSVNTRKKKNKSKSTDWLKKVICVAELRWHSVMSLVLKYDDCPDRNPLMRVPWPSR